MGRLDYILQKNNRVAKVEDEDRCELPAILFLRSLLTEHVA